MTAIIEITGVVKDYGALRAVDGVSFSVPKGLCFGLLGPNGAGKTTTVEIMEGVTVPTAGTVRYRGQPLGRDFKNEVGIQFQKTSLPDHLQVVEVLRLFRSFYFKGMALEDLRALCALESFWKQDVDKLSGGQRQRLLLALALVNDPALLFLDEPTTGLDPQARRNFWGVASRIKAQGKTIILTTHYMEEAYALCDEIAIMDKGRIITQGSPKKLLAGQFEGVVLKLPAAQVPDKPLPFDVHRADGTVQITTTSLHETIVELLRHDVSLKELQIHEPSLEDLFLELTGHQLRS